MIGVDLFSGAGGLSLGAKMAGVRIALAVESNPYAAKTYADNHPETEVFDQDIRQLTAQRVKRIRRGNEGTIVFGGPPCQGFSYSNQRTRSPENPDNWLLVEFMRIVRLWQPDWILFENVQGIVNTANGVFLDELVARVQGLGYTVSHGILNAADFGIPQKRSRFFLVGSRHGIEFAMPQATKAGTQLPRITGLCSKEQFGIYIFTGLQRLLSEAAARPQTLHMNLASFNSTLYSFGLARWKFIFVR